MAGRGVNKVILVGNLGQEPDTKYMPNGRAVCNVSIATTEAWNDKTSGEKVEKTEWHRIVLFGKLAEIAGEYLHKGRQVYIEGYLQTRKWQDQSGADRYTTEIVARDMQMLGGRGTGLSGAENETAAPASMSPDSGGEVSAPSSSSDLDDDIPF